METSNWRVKRRREEWRDVDCGGGSKVQAFTVLASISRGSACGVSPDGGISPALRKADETISQVCGLEGGLIPNMCRRVLTQKYKHVADTFTFSNIMLTCVNRWLPNLARVCTTEEDRKLMLNVINRFLFMGRSELALSHLLNTCDYFSDTLIIMYHNMRFNCWDMYFSTKSNDTSDILVIKPDGMWCSNNSGTVLDNLSIDAICPYRVMNRHPMSRNIPTPKLAKDECMYKVTLYGVWMDEPTGMIINTMDTINYNYFGMTDLSFRMSPQKYFCVSSRFADLHSCKTELYLKFAPISDEPWLCLGVGKVKLNYWQVFMILLINDQIDPNLNYMISMAEVRMDFKDCLYEASAYSKTIVYSNDGRFLGFNRIDPRDEDYQFISEQKIYKLAFALTDLNPIIDPFADMQLVDDDYQVEHGIGDDNFDHSHDDSQVMYPGHNYEYKLATGSIEYSVSECQRLLKSIYSLDFAIKNRIMVVKHETIMCIKNIFLTASCIFKTGVQTSDNVISLMITACKDLINLRHDLFHYFDVVGANKQYFAERPVNQFLIENCLNTIDQKLGKKTPDMLEFENGQIILTEYAVTRDSVTIDRKREKYFDVVEAMERANPGIKVVTNYLVLNISEIDFNVTNSDIQERPGWKYINYLYEIYKSFEDNRKLYNSEIKILLQDMSSYDHWQEVSWNNEFYNNNKPLEYRAFQDHLPSSWKVAESDVQSLLMNYKNELTQKINALNDAQDCLIFLDPVTKNFECRVKTGFGMKVSEVKKWVRMGDFRKLGLYTILDKVDSVMDMITRAQKVGKIDSDKVVSAINSVTLPLAIRTQFLKACGSPGGQVMVAKIFYPYKPKLDMFIPLENVLDLPRDSLNEYIRLYKSDTIKAHLKHSLMFSIKEVETSWVSNYLKYKDSFLNLLASKELTDDVIDQGLSGLKTSLMRQNGEITERLRRSIQLPIITGSDFSYKPIAEWEIMCMTVNPVHLGRRSEPMIVQSLLQRCHKHVIVDTDGIPKHAYEHHQARLVADIGRIEDYKRMLDGVNDEIGKRRFHSGAIRFRIPLSLSKAIVNDAGWYVSEQKVKYGIHWSKDNCDKASLVVNKVIDFLMTENEHKKNYIELLPIHDIPAFEAIKKDMNEFIEPMLSHLQSLRATDYLYAISKISHRLFYFSSQNLNSTKMQAIRICDGCYLFIQGSLYSKYREKCNNFSLLVRDDEKINSDFCFGGNSIYLESDYEGGKANYLWTGFTNIRFSLLSDWISSFETWLSICMNITATVPENPPIKQLKGMIWNKTLSILCRNNGRRKFEEWLTSMHHFIMISISDYSDFKRLIEEKAKHCPESHLELYMLTQFTNNLKQLSTEFRYRRRQRELRQVISMDDEGGNNIETNIDEDRSFKVQRIFAQGSYVSYSELMSDVHIGMVMTKAPVDASVEKVACARKMFKPYMTWGNVQSACDRLRLAKGSYLPADFEEFFKTLILHFDEPFTLNMPMVYSAGVYGANYGFDSAKINGMFKKVCNKPVLSIATSTGMKLGKPGDPDFNFGKGYEAAIEGLKRIDPKIMDKLSKLVRKTLQKTDTAEMDRLNASLVKDDITLLSQATNNVFEQVYCMVEKVQRAGSREIYVMNFTTKIVQQIVEGLFSEMCKQCTNELISIPSDCRNKMLSTILRRYHQNQAGAHCINYYFTADASQWSASSHPDEFVMLSFGLGTVISPRAMQYVADFFTGLKNKSMVLRKDTYLTLRQESLYNTLFDSMLSNTIINPNVKLSDHTKKRMEAKLKNMRSKYDRAGVDNDQAKVLMARAKEIFESKGAMVEIKNVEHGFVMGMMNMASSLKHFLVSSYAIDFWKRHLAKKYGKLSGDIFVHSDDSMGVFAVETNQSNVVCQTLFYYIDGQKFFFKNREHLGRYTRAIKQLHSNNAFKQSEFLGACFAKGKNKLFKEFMKSYHPNMLCDSIKMSSITVTNVSKIHYPIFLEFMKFYQIFLKNFNIQINMKKTYTSDAIAEVLSTYYIHGEIVINIMKFVTLSFNPPGEGYKMDLQNAMTRRNEIITNGGLFVQGWIMQTLIQNIIDAAYSLKRGMRNNVYEYEVEKVDKVVLEPICRGKIVLDYGGKYCTLPIIDYFFGPSSNNVRLQFVDNDMYTKQMLFMTHTHDKELFSLGEQPSLRYYIGKQKLNKSLVDLMNSLNFDIVKDKPTFSMMMPNNNIGFMVQLASRLKDYKFVNGLKGERQHQKCIRTIMHSYKSNIYVNKLNFTMQGMFLLMHKYLRTNLNPDNTTVEFSMMQLVCSLCAKEDTENDQKVNEFCKAYLERVREIRRVGADDSVDIILKTSGSTALHEVYCRLSESNMQFTKSGSNLITTKPITASFGKDLMVLEEQMVRSNIVSLAIDGEMPLITNYTPIERTQAERLQYILTQLFGEGNKGAKLCYIKSMRDVFNRKNFITRSELTVCKNPTDIISLICSNTFGHYKYTLVNVTPYELNRPMLLSLVGDTIDIRKNGYSYFFGALKILGNIFAKLHINVGPHELLGYKLKYRTSTEIKTITLTEIADITGGDVPDGMGRLSLIDLKKIVSSGNNEVVLTNDDDIILYCWPVIQIKQNGVYTGFGVLFIKLPGTTATIYVMDTEIWGVVTDDIFANNFDNNVGILSKIFFESGLQPNSFLVSGDVTTTIMYRRDFIRNLKGRSLAIPHFVKRSISKDTSRPIDEGSMLNEQVYNRIFLVNKADDYFEYSATVKWELPFHFIERMGERGRRKHKMQTIPNNLLQSGMDFMNLDSLSNQTLLKKLGLVDDDIRYLMCKVKRNQKYDNIGIELPADDSCLMSGIIESVVRRLDGPDEDAGMIQISDIRLLIDRDRNLLKEAKIKGLNFSQMSTIYSCDTFLLDILHHKKIIYNSRLLPDKKLILQAGPNCPFDRLKLVSDLIPEDEKIRIRNNIYSLLKRDVNKPEIFNKIISDCKTHGYDIIKQSIHETECLKFKLFHDLWNLLTELCTTLIITDHNYNDIWAILYELYDPSRYIFVAEIMKLTSPISLYFYLPKACINFLSMDTYQVMAPTKINVNAIKLLCKLAKFGGKERDAILRYLDTNSEYEVLTNFLANLSFMLMFQLSNYRLSKGWKRFKVPRDFVDSQKRFVNFVNNNFDINVIKAFPQFESGQDCQSFYDQYPDDESIEIPGVWMDNYNEMVQLYKPPKPFVVDWDTLYIDWSKVFLDVDGPVLILCNVLNVNIIYSKLALHGQAKVYSFGLSSRVRFESIIHKFGEMPYKTYLYGNHTATAEIICHKFLVLFMPNSALLSFEQHEQYINIMTLDMDMTVRLQPNPSVCSHSGIAFNPENGLFMDKITQMWLQKDADDPVQQLKDSERSRTMFDREMIDVVYDRSYREQLAQPPFFETRHLIKYAETNDLNSLYAADEFVSLELHGLESGQEPVEVADDMIAMSANFDKLISQKLPERKNLQWHDMLQSGDVGGILDRLMDCAVSADIISIDQAQSLFDTKVRDEKVIKMATQRMMDEIMKGRRFIRSDDLNAEFDSFAPNFIEVLFSTGYEIDYKSYETLLLSCTNLAKTIDHKTTQFMNSQKRSEAAFTALQELRSLYWKAVWMYGMIKLMTPVNYKGGKESILAKNISLTVNGLFSSTTDPIQVLDDLMMGLADPDTTDLGLTGPSSNKTSRLAWRN